MKRLRKFVFTIVGPAIFLAAAAVLVQQKYEPIVAAPVVTHDAVATPSHTLRAVFYPPMAHGALGWLAHLPGWIILPFAPREMAVLAEPDLDAQTVRLAIFVNDQRLGPVIAGYANEPKLSADVPFVDWDERGCVREAPGSMVLQGTLPLKPEVATLVRGLRKSTAMGEAPPLEGGHMFEAALNNENNGALAAFLCLYACLDSGPPVFDFDVVAKNLSAVKIMRVVADFTSDDVLNVQLVLTGWPEAEEAMAELAFLTEVVRNEAAQMLWKDPYKIGFGGGTERQGTTVTANYVFSGLAAFFEKDNADA